MILEDRIERVKSKLMLSHPFFGSLSTTLKFEKSDDIESFSVKNQTYFYNDEYLQNLSDDELIFTLANASMHQALEHDSRKTNRMSWLWELATDYTINSLLLENGLTLAPKVNYDSRYDGMYAEEIYEELKINIDNQEEQEDDSDNLNDNVRTDKIIQDEQRSQQFAQFLENLTIKFDKRGELPNSIERVIKLKKQSLINWRDELYRYINSHAKSDYRFFPPNMKYLYMGFALPSIYGQKLEIAVAIDTSASIDHELLEQFLAELNEIMGIYDNYEIIFIECDYKIQNIKVLSPFDKFKVQVSGGGGTDFNPVFQYLSEKDIKFLIYFTDGKGVFPPISPMFDILWIMRDFMEVPFGDLITLSS